MTKDLFIALTILLFTAGSVSAKTTADLSLTGIGARPLGMGKAFTAISGGSNTMSFNPAGIGFVSAFEITTMQTKILNTSDYKMYGGVLATNIGNFGINYVNVLSPAGYVTTDRNSLATAQSMAYTGSTFIFSFGQNMSRLMKISPNMGNLAIGANIKIVRNFMSGITNGNGTGVDGDLGLLLMTPNNFNFGVSLQNYMRGNIAWESGTKDKLPSIFRAGISYKINKPNILFAMDAENYAEDNKPMLLHTGVEWHTSDYLVIRFGIDQCAINTINTINNMTYGVGLKLFGVTFDYAFRENGQQADASAHYLSLSFSPEKP